jgi:hypothetical protein
MDLILPSRRVRRDPMGPTTVATMRDASARCTPSLESPLRVQLSSLGFYFLARAYPNI